MAKNCLVTKLKGVVNNDDLPVYGELVLETRLLTGNYSCGITIEAVEPITVSVRDGGYFSTVKANVETDRLTSINIPANTSTDLYFANTAPTIHISDKYAVKSLYAITSGASNPNFLAFDVAKLEGCEALETLRIVFTGCYGRASSLGALASLKNVYVSGTGLTGNIASLGTLTLARILRIYSTGITGTVEAFVAAQIAAGRTTCSPNDLELRGILDLITFGGNLYPGTSTSYYYWAEWTDASHITLYKTGQINNYSYSSVNTIYAKGASAEQIAGWEGDGKTVVVVS